jgi:hypothetical protein
MEIVPGQFIFFHAGDGAFFAATLFCVAVLSHYSPHLT